MTEDILSADNEAMHQVRNCYLSRQLLVVWNKKAHFTGYFYGISDIIN